jgi:hypothetical protein
MVEDEDEVQEGEGAGDANEMSREIYAHFGLAYYSTECIHRGLAHLVAILPLDPRTATRPRLEERLKSFEGMTFGELVPRAKEVLPCELHASLDWALVKRNFLAHGFWYERIHMCFSEEGRALLLAELNDTTEVLHELDRVLDDLAFAHLQRLGVHEEALASAMDEARKAPPDPLPPRSVPKSNETVEIVAAWLVGDDARRAGLVLQSRDGLFWQLCDVGLGWSYEKDPDPSWRPSRSLSAYLPASMVARPKGAKPWSYKLHLSTGALLFVEQNPETGLIRWGVKRVKPLEG